jgi:hypothetical protein
VVADIENANASNSSISIRTKVVLPAPDGAVTNIDRGFIIFYFLSCAFGFFL